ncbi:MAG TPA: bifunctional adenosylcobinamide kinase/adenosylcobinamide-phosphate guanylyltransferase [Streptosporangiaceae bacterium]|nr:bifunctional adenosylcobinamide kinase/adenosylcobinamide-phosphate guanylyltransferase [Streptosporangiaceae bacterium]
MHVLLTGTGGADGWPHEGCRCASCMRARSAGVRRAPGQVRVDGMLEFGVRQLMTNPTATAGTAASASSAHRIAPLPGGIEVTSPDGGRLLLAAGPAQVPEPAPGSAPYDIALLDLLASPAQLGRLRAAGFVSEQTIVVAMYCDHRISSEQELARRCQLWGVAVGHDGQLISSRDPTRPGATGSVASGVSPTGPARPHRTLIIGGGRSGKSTEAELRLAGEPSVTYLAAGPWAAVAAGSGSGQPGSWIGPDGQPDAEWARRVATHRARRPPDWRTVESLDIAGQLRQETGALLIDGIGTWLAGVMDQAGVWAGDTRGAEILQGRIDELIEAWRQTSALLVAVSDQVGAGLVPAYPSGRAFRDQLGWLNQRLAAESEVVLLTVAGRVTTLPG